jgi:hypothetical protein
MEGGRNAAIGIQLARAFFPFALHLDYMCGAVPVKDALSPRIRVSLTGPSPHKRRSAQESEGEETKYREQVSVDNGRPSHGRVRFAAPDGAPWTAPGRSEQLFH